MAGYVDFGLNIRLLSARRSVSEEFGHGYAVIWCCHCDSFPNPAVSLPLRKARGIYWVPDLLVKAKIFLCLFMHQAIKAYRAQRKNSTHS